MHPITVPLVRATRPTIARAALGLAGIALAGGLVAACGGGGSAPTQVSKQSTTWVNGPIRGFGSVIVNGVRFDDSTAQVTDDEGRALGTASLALGMEVEVAGDDSGGHAVAHGFHVHSAAVGPVEAVDAAAGTLTVIGQPVVVDGTTVIDDSLPGGLAGLALGTVLRVYGTGDASGVLHATRLEAAGAVVAYRIVGAVTAYDLVDRRLTIGAAVIDVSAVPALPAGLAAGTRVRVTLDTTAVGGTWRATAVSSDRNEAAGDQDQADVEGAITSFTSATSFSIGSTPVDASQAAFPDGTGGVVLGALVEVEGALVNGVLVASKVEVKSAHEQQGQDIELHGLVSSLDTTAMTFMLRGSLVSYAGADVQFLHGTIASLVEGVHVEVKGDLAVDGHTVQAVTIDFTAD